MPLHLLGYHSTTPKAKNLFFVGPIPFLPIQPHFKILLSTTVQRKKFFLSGHTEYVFACTPEIILGINAASGGCSFCLHQHPAAVVQHDWSTGHVACPNRCPPAQPSNGDVQKKFSFCLPRDRIRSCVRSVFRTGDLWNGPNSRRIRS